MFISPTEPKTLRDIGVVDMMPEEYGSDIFWESERGSVGVQRKVIPDDFFASVQDGRLAKQITQMQRLDFRILILEGQCYWSSEGNLMDQFYNHWTKDNYSLHLLNIQMKGILVAFTESLTETIRFVRRLPGWLEKASGYSLEYRPHAEKSQWGTREAEDYQSYFLQGIPRTGPKTARAIIETVGFPFSLNVTEEELLSVPGVGPTWVGNLRKVFGEKNQGISE